MDVLGAIPCRLKCISGRVCHRAVRHFGSPPDSPGPPGTPPKSAQRTSPDPPGSPREAPRSLPGGPQDTPEPIGLGTDPETIPTTRLGKDPPKDQGNYRSASQNVLASIFNVGVSGDCPWVTLPQHDAGTKQSAREARAMFLVTHIGRECRKKPTAPPHPLDPPGPGA